MSIVATPDAAYSPPRVAIALGVGAGNVMASASVWRVRDGRRTLLRTQPELGSDVATVYDYECPRQVPVTYEWSGTYTDPVAYPTVWNETWSNTSAWTAVGTWNVSAGKVRNTGTGFQTLTRATGVAKKHRVTVGSIAGFADGARVEFLNAGVVKIALYLDPFVGTLIILVNGVSIPNAISPASPMLIDMLGNTVTITGTGGTASSAQDVSIDSVRLTSVADFANEVVIGSIFVQDYPAAPTAISGTSNEITLDVDETWLVHPALVNLSVPLGYEDVEVLGIGDIGSIRNAADVAMHKVMGNPRPVSVASGDRGDDELTMTLSSVTRAEELALVELFRDQTPILILTPPSWKLDFADDYYQVGDVVRTRLIQVEGFTYKDIAFPLVAVESPAVNVSDSNWTYNVLVVVEATYDSIPLDFATYSDVETRTEIA